MGCSLQAQFLNDAKRNNSGTTSSIYNEGTNLPLNRAPRMKNVFPLPIFNTFLAAQYSSQNQHFSLIGFLYNFFLVLLLILLKIRFPFLLILPLVYCFPFGQSNDPSVCAVLSCMSKSLTPKPPTSAKRSWFGHALQRQDLLWSLALLWGERKGCHERGERKGAPLVIGLIMGWQFQKLTFEKP